MNKTYTRGQETDLKARTGVHAPASGWWRPEDDPEPFRYLQQGDLMPALGGHETQWVLVYALNPSLRANFPGQRGASGPSSHPERGEFR